MNITYLEKFLTALLSYNSHAIKLTLKKLRYGRFRVLYEFQVYNIVTDNF